MGSSQWPVRVFTRPPPTVDSKAGFYRFCRRLPRRPWRVGPYRTTGLADRSRDRQRRRPSHVRALGRDLYRAY